MTKEEAQRIVNGALGNLHNALADVTNSLPARR
jgi:hypothetical protein